MYCYFWFSLMVPCSNVCFTLNKNLFLLFSLKSHKTCLFFCWTLSDLSQSWFLSPEKIQICFHQVVGTLLAWNHFKLNKLAGYFMNHSSDTNISWSFSGRPACPPPSPSLFTPRVFLWFGDERNGLSSGSEGTFF